MVGAPQFARGDEVVLFLKGSAPAVPMPYGLTQGVYRVNRDASGRAMVTPSANVGPTASSVATPRGDHWSSGVHESRPDDRGRPAMIGRRFPVWIAIAVFALGLPGTADAYIISAWISPATPGRSVDRAARALVRQRRRRAGRVGGAASERARAGLHDVGGRAHGLHRLRVRGFTSAIPFDDDDLSVFGFESEPDMDRVLGATTFIVDVISGASSSRMSSSTRYSPGRWLLPETRPGSISDPSPRTKSGTSSALAIRPSGKPK